MPRTLRLEFAGGIYHVINRGNYRSAIFAEDKTKAAFLRCLAEVCARTAWTVHAWCIMSNHYHLAVETPRPNLVEGMQWLQGTFATRFNRLRSERGHLFQGRYKSLIVDPDGLGALCHYIHLNPVRARRCPVNALEEWLWTSVRWLTRAGERPPWYRPDAALAHAGGLADTAAGRRKYVQYLAWLAEDEPAKKSLLFDRMCRGWVIGASDFKKALVRDHEQAAAGLARGDDVVADLKEAVLREELEKLLKTVGKSVADLEREGKSVAWKLAVAAAMKARTVVTNRWLAENLAMGNRYEVSRKVHAWSRRPDARLARKLQLTPNPKT